MMLREVRLLLTTYISLYIVLQACKNGKSFHNTKITNKDRFEFNFPYLVFVQMNSMS